MPKRTPPTMDENRARGAFPPRERAAMTDIANIYGSMVFNEHTMQERLPSATYKQLMKTMKEGAPLNEEVANVVAHAMKEWAIEKGATHYPRNWEKWMLWRRVSLARVNEVYENG